MTLRCSGQQTCDVLIPGVEVDHLNRFLALPKRAMNALLGRNKLEGLADNRFIYMSRPYKILHYNIQPKVTFAVEWNGSLLKIVFESCQITGLDKMAEMIVFNCTATLKPEHARIVADAEAELTLEKNGVMALLPDAVLLKLGSKVLDSIFDRLQNRCQKRFQNSLSRWLKKHPFEPI